MAYERDAGRKKKRQASVPEGMPAAFQKDIGRFGKAYVFCLLKVGYKKVILSFA